MSFSSVSQNQGVEREKPYGAAQGYLGDDGHGLWRRPYSGGSVTAAAAEERGRAEEEKEEEGKKIEGGGSSTES